jgi:cation-transporting ATPase E
MSENPLPGLTSAEVAARVAAGQVNRTKRSDLADYADIFRRNVFTLFNFMVAPAAVALFWLGEWKGGLAVSALAIINSVIALIHEIKAKIELDRLAILVETKARVRRDGQVTTVPAGDVVLDDVILISNGEAVVADGPVLESRYLEVDEALLTGESDPVRRGAGERLLSGSFCVAGEGAYRADKVGAESFAQKTSARAREYSVGHSPLQHVINVFVKWLSYTAVLLCAVYIAAYFVDRPDPADEAAVLAAQQNLVKYVAITVTSMVPQGLVLTATMAFILGAVVMSRRGAVVQRVNAVESMAAVDVICTDKTGTLTTNRLELETIRPLDGRPEDEVRRLLALFATAGTDDKNKSIQAIRARLGLASGVELIDQLPFKSQNRYSAVRVRADSAERVLVMGAAEALSKHLADPAADGWRQPFDELMKTGRRVLMFAESERTESFAAGTLEGFPLRPLGLLALSDELRPEAGAVLEQFTAQGIAFKIISGDNPETVRATVGMLKIPLAHEPVVSGDQLENAADKDDLILNRSVFGRVAPNQKVDIVEGLKRHGRYVAMIGDGVNDVLPIKKAHLGIAMGEGSSASKTVSGLVLENNSFALLPETLEEGRTIVRNLRRSAKLFLTKNVYAVFLLLAGVFPFTGLPRPFEPQQVTLLNWMTIGIPAFVIALSRERSRAATKPNFLAEVGWFVLRTGVVLGVCGLVLETLAAHVYGCDAATLRTMLLSYLTLTGLTTLLRTLTDAEEAGLRGDTKYRWFAAAAVPVYLAFMYLPPTAAFFVLTPLDRLQWGLVLAVSAPAAGLCLLSDRLGNPFLNRR